MDSQASERAVADGRGTANLGVHDLAWWLKSRSAILIDNPRRMATIMLRLMMILSAAVGVSSAGRLLFFAIHAVEHVCLGPRAVLPLPRRGPT